MAQAGFTADDDLIQSAANYSKQECLNERRQLVVELTRIQNELLGAKATRNKREVEALGLKHQSIQKRLGLIKQRLHDIQEADPDSGSAFRRAVIELVPQDLLDRIYVREREIRTPTSQETDHG